MSYEITATDNSKSVIEEVQDEVTRVEEIIATSKALMPNANVNFGMYDIVLNEAKRAIREQDVAALVKILPKLKEMH